MLSSVIIVYPPELIHKRLVDVSDGIGALLKFAGSIGAVCLVTLGSQSTDIMLSECL